MPKACPVCPALPTLASKNDWLQVPVFCASRALVLMAYRGCCGARGQAITRGHCRESEGLAALKLPNNISQLPLSAPARRRRAPARG